MVTIFSIGRVGQLITRSNNELHFFSECLRVFNKTDIFDAKTTATKETRLFY